MTTTAPPRGGYDYQFVNTPADTLTCTVCSLVSKEPCLSECCGHTFCKSCFEGSKQSSNICPMCHSEEFASIFNKQADRQIQSLFVYCTNKKQGCEWQGAVNDIDAHLDNCQFQVIHCPNECGECLQQQHLTDHVETECPRRTVSCQYCNDVGEYQFIEGQHKEECPKFPVQCPNECEIKSLHRDEVEEHKKMCPLEKVQCDYHVVGCKVKMARKNMNTHKQEMMELHLSLSINELMETKVQLKSSQNNLKSEVEKTKDDLTQQLVQAEKNFTAKLTASQQETKKMEDQLLQKLAATEKELNTTKHQLATACQNLATKAEKDTLVDKPLVKIDTKIQAESVNTAEKKIAELETKLQQKTVQIETIIHNHWLTSLCRQASKLASDNQVVPVVIKMSEYAKNKDTIWSSKPFYDNYKKECKLKLQVAASKYRNSYMSVSLLSMTSAKRPTGTIVVRLLNQISDSEHYLGGTAPQAAKKASGNVNTVWQNDYFISYQDLHKDTVTHQFLKDDALFFEVHTEI